MALDDSNLDTYRTWGFAAHKAGNVGSISANDVGVGIIMPLCLRGHRVVDPDIITSAKIGLPIGHYTASGKDFVLMTRIDYYLTDNGKFMGPVLRTSGSGSAFDRSAFAGVLSLDVASKIDTNPLFRNKICGNDSCDLDLKGGGLLIIPGGDDHGGKLRNDVVLLDFCYFKDFNPHTAIKSLNTVVRALSSDPKTWFGDGLPLINSGMNVVVAYTVPKT